MHNPTIQQLEQLHVSIIESEAQQLAYTIIGRGFKAGVQMFIEDEHGNQHVTQEWIAFYMTEKAKILQAKLDKLRIEANLPLIALSTIYK